jgi:hypothetical protein
MSWVTFCIFPLKRAPRTFFARTNVGREGWWRQAGSVFGPLPVLWLATSKVHHAEGLSRALLAPIEFGARSI